MGVIQYIWNRLIIKLYDSLPTVNRVIEKFLLFVILQTMLVSVLCMPHLEITEHTIPTGFFSSIKRRYCNIQIYFNPDVCMKSMFYTVLALTELKGHLHYISLIVYAFVFGRNWWLNVSSCWVFFATHDYGDDIINAKPLGIMLITYFALQVVLTMAVYAQSLYVALLESNELNALALTFPDSSGGDNILNNEQNAALEAAVDVNSVEGFLDAIALNGNELEIAGNAADHADAEAFIHSDDDEYLVVLGPTVDGADVINFLNVERVNQLQQGLGAGDF